MTLAARRADASGPEVLVIDEINRGNVAKVLGELYFLMEYRKRSARLLYSPTTPFQMPEDLLFIGTMNTADRSIALLDSALRRRFYFVPFFPDAEPVRDVLRRWLVANKSDLEWLADVVDEVNERLVARLSSRHAMIGPSHFIKDDLDERWIRLIWEYSTPSLTLRSSSSTSTSPLLRTGSTLSART